jgi:hypothetical protein
MFVLSCVQLSASRRADPPSKESYRLRKTYRETGEEARAQETDVKPLMKE